jgi:hypothetical protein
MQYRGLFVTLDSMWALGSEPTGPKLCRAFPWPYINEKQPGYDIFRLGIILDLHHPNI